MNACLRAHIRNTLRLVAALPAFYSLSASALVCPVYLEQDAFAEIFHKVTPASEQTVTSLREELKVIVNRSESDVFLEDSRRLAVKSKGATFGLRDSPPAGKEFVTDTWYWSPFKNTDEEGNTRFRAVLRARLYDEVDAGTKVANLERSSPEESVPRHPVALTDDTAKVYRKLEFKVGHPFELDSGIDGQIPGVVDKPGVVLPERDILLLLQDQKTYLANRERILNEGERIQRSGKSVNSRRMLDEIVARIGVLHAESPAPIGPPVVRIRYKREAWQATFRTYDPIAKASIKVPVQITFDREVQIEDFTSKTFLGFDVSNFALTAGGGKAPVTVVEFKVPLQFASLTDDELRKRGLGALAEMRERFAQLNPAANSVRNSGKQSNGLRELNESRNIPMKAD